MDSEARCVLGEMWQEACERGKILSFKMVSGSMSPMIEVGDVVKVSGVKPSEIRIGDIVAFREDQNVMVHRVISKTWSNQQLSFRHGVDAGRLPGKIAAQNLIGKVLVVKKRGREIFLGTPWFIMSNRILGWRLHLINALSRMRPSLLRIVLHQALRPPWKLCRDLLLRRL